MQRIVGFIIVFTVGFAMAVPGFVVPGYSHTNFFNLIATGIGFYLMYRSVVSLFSTSPADDNEPVESLASSGDEYVEVAEENVEQSSAIQPTETDIHTRKVAELCRYGYFTLVLWPAFLFAGFMAFDAPSADKHVWPYVALAFGVFYGAVPLVTNLISYWARKNGRIRTAYFVAAIPFIVAALPFVLKDFLHLLRIFS